MRFLTKRSANHIVYNDRKECFPARNKKRARLRSACSGSMTLEAACALPLFLFAMLAILQFAKISIVSTALLASMEDTVKDMAEYAYIQELGVSAGDGVAAELLTGGISAIYAKGSVENKANLKESDGTISLWKSSFFRNDILDLAITYKAKKMYVLLPTPTIKAALRTRVRAWTGRDGNGSSEDGEEEDDSDGETVFVTETGTVYHTDENCTHIHLSLQMVSRSIVGELRNESGGKYHACEKCYGGTGEDVYITDYGDRYHSSVGCSGITRNVREVSLSELKGWRACSKCGK